MANCHKNFLTAKNSYHSRVALDDSKKDSLKTSRKGLRKHIKAKFEEKKRPAIKFQIQGSFGMRTAVNPLDGDYDIDDGLYFKPQLEDRPTPETVHSWVVEAAESYGTVDPPLDKKRCVRVPFKDGYHVDLPIYDLVDDGNGSVSPDLAVKGDGWVFSDPKNIADWFDNRVSDTNPLLRRLVRYFKAWADYQNRNNNPKMPSGLALTVLCADEYQYKARDVEAFCETAAAILERIENDDSIPNPKDKNEDLRHRMTDAQMENFKRRLSNLVLHAETALEHNSQEKAAQEWVKVLGDRFPVLKDDLDKPGKSTKAQASPGLLTVGSTSA